MRNRLRFRPDSAAYSPLPDARAEFFRKAPPESEESFSRLVAAFSASGAAPARDLALDLLLNSMAEEVRISTGADGVAIALTRTGELVCRAATGSAPDLGVQLNPYSGLSGLCLHTKTVQRCDDAEIDPRVDIAACRSLKIRSILMVPVMRAEETIGLLETLSANPGHFGQQDVDSLISFASRIVETIDSARDAPASDSSGGQEVDAKAHVAEVLISEVRTHGRSWEQWTIFLTFALIATALLLGWMIGLGDRHIGTGTVPARSRAKIQPASEDSGSHSVEAPRIAARSDPAKPAAVLNLSKPSETDGGLVVYQSGKEIFREAPRKGNAIRKVPATAKHGEITSPAGSSPTGVFGASNPAASAASGSSAQDSASQYVTYRVQPVYPEAARKQRIHGPVVLKVLVGKDGGVQQVQALSGDKTLATAAADAVVQWRFTPVLRSGQPVEFQTEITVDFKLP